MTVPQHAIAPRVPVTRAASAVPQVDADAGPAIAVAITPTIAPPIAAHADPRTYAHIIAPDVTLATEVASATVEAAVAAAVDRYASASTVTVPHANAWATTAAALHVDVAATATAATALDSAATTLALNATASAHRGRAATTTPAPTRSRFTSGASTLRRLFALAARRLKLRKDGLCGGRGRWIKAPAAGRSGRQWRQRQHAYTGEK